jgi:ABC-type multidrug transport system fused ATPase/permease subunit
MLHTCSPRHRICKCLACESSLHYRWICTWRGHRRWKHLRPALLRLFIQQYVDGECAVIGLKRALTLFQNFGIMIAFGVGFLAWLMITTELNSKVAESRSVMLFKRGAKAVDASNSSVDDEEKAGAAPVQGISRDGSDLADQELAKTNDVFSWQNISYTIPISGGETRKLLSDVSGFVVPGKLTALMGESGAGKVRS